jgi:hypothetical protein
MESMQIWQRASCNGTHTTLGPVVVVGGSVQYVWPLQYNRGLGAG